MVSVLWPIEVPSEERCHGFDDLLACQIALPFGKKLGKFTVYDSNDLTFYRLTSEVTNSMPMSVGAQKREDTF